MFNNKTSVDQHVAEVTSTYTEYEINLSSYYIARNYYNVGDYEKAREYVLRYLKVEETSADAYKLLGQIFDARDQKEAASAKAKYSLETDGKEVNFVYKSDPSSGISAALFHVRLLVHYIDNKKLEIGYKHAVDVEENYDFKDNLQWTQTVCRLLEMCKIMHSFDWKFWILYSSCLERLTKFFLKKGVDKPLPRFRPFIGNDTMFLNGITKAISTRMYCVTCMKEYDGKSIEEVRLEYYIAGRKLQTQGLSSPLLSFGATDWSTTSRFHALIKPSTARLRAPASTSRGSFSQQNRPIVFGAAAQSSDFGSAKTIQTPFKGFWANNTSGPNSFGGVEPNESTGALNQNNKSAESVKDAGFSFGSPKFIDFGVSTAPKFGTKSLLSEQTNTSEPFGNTNTISNSKGAFELGDQSWRNDGTTGTGVETSGGRMAANSAEQDTGANQVDKLVLDQLQILSESNKTLLKNIRTWQERVASLKETVKHTKCELLSTVEAELLDGVELCNVSTSEVDDRASTKETKTVATNTISVKAQQKEDSPKPKAGEMFELAGKLKTQDDVNMSSGQAKASLLTSVETVSKTEEKAKIVEAAQPAVVPASREAANIPVVIGGFSFTSNPIIQEKQSNDAAEAAQKSNETSTPSPFARFSFTKPDSTSESEQTKNANTRVPAATINAVGVQPAQQKTGVNNQKSLAEMFKPATGSWECKGCYIVNSGSNSYCVACDSPKDPSMPAKPKTGGFNIASPSATFPSLSFGTPATAPQRLESNFNFKIQNSNAVAAEYSAKAPVGITFGSAFSVGTPRNFGLLQNPAKPYAGLALGSSGQPFSFQIPAKPTLKIPDGDKKSKHQVVESVDVDFAPVVPLPDKVDVKTGEENEEILYSHRAKLFRYESGGKEWKERGLGDIKLLKHRESGKLRLLMRRDQVLKLCLNHIITPDMEFTPKDDKTWLWYAADYSEGDISHENFACRFKTAEIAQEFKTAIDKAKESTKTPAEKAAPKTTEKSPVTIKKNLFGRSNSTSDVEIVYETTVTPEEKAAALKLKLPENFYAYKKMPDCPGCIGCKDNQESPLISETTDVPKTVIPPSSIETPKPVSAGIFGSKSSIFVPPKLNPPSQLTRTPVTSPSASGDLKVTAFGSTPSITQTSTASANTISLSFGEKPVGTIFGNVGSAGSVPSTTATTLGSGFSTKSTISFGAPATTTSSSNIFGGSSSLPATTSSSNIFGGSASTVANTGAGISFAANTPKTVGFLFGAQPAQPAPQAPAIQPIFGSVSTTSNTNTIFSFGAATNGKSAESKTESKSFENLKICSPSSLTSTTLPSAPSIPLPEMSKADQDFAEKSRAFKGLSTPAFGVPTSTLPNPVVLESVNEAPPETKKEGEFSFLPPENAASFSTLAAKASQQPAFQTDPNFSFAGAGATVFGAKQAANALQSQAKTDSGVKDDENEEDGEPDNGEEHDPHFEPIVPLSDAIEVRTGEEDEEKVFGQRAKLYFCFFSNNDCRGYKKRLVL